MITSRHNPRLKTIRGLRRSKGSRKHLLLEGPHLLAAAIDVRLPLLEVLVTPEFIGRPSSAELLARLPAPATEVAPSLLNELADTDAPRGILAIAETGWRSCDEVPVDLRASYVFADGLQDPGNLGALARTANAAGVRALVLSPHCVDPAHPRALRAAAGSLLRLPVAVGVRAEELAVRLAPANPRWLALSPDGETEHWSAALAPPAVLMIGSEASGLTAACRAMADATIRIPMAPEVESLNVVAAAAVVLFEIARGRGGRG